MFETNPLNRKPATTSPQGRILVWGTLAILVVAFFLFVEYSYLQKSAVDAKVAAENTERSTLLDLKQGRDFEALTERSQVLANTAANPGTVSVARSIEAYGKFMLATPETRRDAVKIAMNLFTTNADPVVKARAINQLLEFVTVSRSQDIFDAVFTSDSFSKHYKKNDYAGSIASMGEESFKLNPTIVGAGYSIVGDTGRFTNFGQTYTLTEQEKKAHIDAALLKLPRLQAGYDAELAALGSSANVPFQKYKYFHWYTQVLGALSRADSKTYGDQAIQSYESMFALYDSTKGSDGKPLPILELRIPIDHMFYAQLLIRLGGDANLAKARTQLKTIMDMLTADPELHKSQYIQFLKEVGSGKSATQETSTKMFQTAGDAYPPFKEFVKQYGIVLK